MTCPHCHEPITTADLFCEACGADLATTADPAANPAAIPTGASTGEREAGSGGPVTSVVSRTADPDEPDVGAVVCLACGGAVGPDWFCTSCGFKARTPRDHWTESPTPWVGGVCDKGISHARNEDAMALAATTEAVTVDGGGVGRAVLVVCDGVTSAPDSDRASIAAARTACAALASVVEPQGSVPARLEAWKAALESACADAHGEAVAVARRLGDPPEPPSCTFVAAVATAGVACVAWCGDSRAYWLPDVGPGRQLGVDHSIGSELIAAGATPEEAERHPQFHTITRWLGADSIDPTPEFASIPLDAPGYLLACSDGMWNYANGVDALAELMRIAAAAGAVGPLALSESLAAWANDQGGHDNISVALARIDLGPEPSRVP